MELRKDTHGNNRGAAGGFRPRTYLNVLVSGHRPDRLPDDRKQQEILKDKLKEILDCINQNCQTNKKTLRILSGKSEGVDQWIYELNKEFFRVPFFSVATFYNKSSENFSYVHNVSIADSPSGSLSGQSSPETWIKATDEIKLDYADLMIAVWDGEPPRGHMGGVVRLLMEALRRHIPVVLIDASSKSLGTILLSRTEMIDSSQHYRLKIEEYNFSWVKSDLFEKVNIKDLGAFFSKKLRNEDALLREYYVESEKLDPNQKVTVSGIFHERFLSLFGKKRKKKIAPIKAYRGKEESFLEKTLPEAFWQYFDMFDRSAAHAANKYRDKVVGIHLLSSLAVLGAVAGSVVQSDVFEILWGVGELVSLGLILVLLRERKQKTNSHDVWLSYRQAAEAFRINVFLRSQLSTLPQLHESIWSEIGERHKSEASSPKRSSQKKIRLANPSLWVVTQIFHEAGPPCSPNIGTDSGKGYILTEKRQELIAQMQELIADQKNYHEGNQEQNLKVHERIEKITVGAFSFIFLFVIFHLTSSIIPLWRGEHSSSPLSDVITFLHNRYALFVTAFLPALVAAFHDVHSQLELNRVAKNSREMSERLKALKATLETVERKDKDPIVLRNLARELAQTLYQEHDAWGKLMKEQHLDVPA